MSIFRKVTLEILKKNKTRTVVTIIGIILSASMFTAVTATVTSLQNFLLQNAIYNEGDWHVSATEVDETFFDFMKNPASQLEDSDEKEYFSKGKVESYVYSQQLGYAFAEGCTNEYKPYLYIIGADKAFCEAMPVHLTGGRLPEKSDEILLPEHLAENGEVHYKVGDVLTLEIGNRVADGYVLGQHNPYMNAEEGEPAEGSDVSVNTERETLEVKEVRTFTVVGFYERPNFENYSAPGYTAITAMDKVRPEGSLYNIYFKMTNPQDAMHWFNHLTVSANYNNSVLTYLGVSGYSGFYVVLYGLAAVVIGLIMFGSISLIYNAFSISVSERTKQFGLLSSIGATRKQLRQMVLFEALFVSGIGIPLGILAGIGGMGITFHFIGKEFTALIDYAIPLVLCVYPSTIVAACVITLATVLVSAWIPSKRATMVTAVEAIRQSGDVKLSRREQKRIMRQGAKSRQIRKNQGAPQDMEQEHKTTWIEKLTYQLFGLPGMIAGKYFNRSKKKYRATVVSLFMSIVLFVSASALTSYLTDAVEAGFERDNYDIVYYYDPTTYMTLDEIEAGDFTGLLSQDELSELFAQAESVTEAAFVNLQVQHIKIGYEHLSESYLAYLAERNEKLGLTDTEEASLFFGAVFVEDSVYEAFLREQNLDTGLYMNPEAPLAVAIDGNTTFDYDLEKYVTKNILKSTDTEIVFTDETHTTTLKSGVILYERPYFVSDLYDVSFLYPYSMKEAVLQETAAKSYSCTHYIQSDDHEKSYASMKNITVENGLSKHHLYDYAEGREESQTLIMIINVFSYGFITLISLIAAANVFNTISTNISLRRREFAMLKSVGMSGKEMNRMMNFECLLYGSRALLYGIPVSIGITWIIYRIVSEGYTAGFYVPLEAIGIAVCSVFVVVFATMMYSMRKIKADNPIDALKNENI